jgi:glycosyltransferase involved in cell wall biosynthesis
VLDERARSARVARARAWQRRAPRRDLATTAHDRSVEVARAAGARVVHVAHRGYGSAYRGGFAAARGAIVVMGDSDDTYDFSKIDELVAPLAHGADLVLGSRLRGAIQPGAMPWLHRYVGNPLLSATLNLFYRTKISDTHSGFRAFRREAFERLGVRTTGMEFALEMLILRRGQAVDHRRGANLLPPARRREAAHVP